MNYIYLDWNVIQDIKHKRDRGEELGHLITRIKHKYSFPFSKAHLEDLSHSEQKYIQEDLQYLKQLSDNYYVDYDAYTEISDPQKCSVNINDLFSNTVKDLEEEQKQFNQMNFTDNIHMRCNFEIDINKISDDNLFKSIIQKNNSILDMTAMHTFINMLKENIDKPDFYKQFRSNVASITAMTEEKNIVLDQNSEYFKKLKPFLSFIIDTDLTSIKKNFFQTMTSFLCIDNKRNFSLLNKSEQIELIYSLLDFNPLFRDSINQRNKPNNMIRDLKHFLYASNAKYYITKDKAAYEKSKFTAEILKLKVKIMKIEKFISTFS